MKRGGPLERKSPLQQGTSQLVRTEMKRGKPMARTAPVKRVEVPQKTPPASQPGRQSRKKPRRNDGPWRDEVMAAFGQWCHAFGVGPHSGPIQAAHIRSKGQQGPSVVENGLPLCEGHHTAYDNYRLQLDYEWLAPIQVAWLAEDGYCRWDEHGQPTGQGIRRFAPLTSGQLARHNERNTA